MRAAVVLLLALAASAHAERVQVSVAVDQLSAAIEAGRFGDAYRQAGDLVAEHGGDPDVRYWAAVACLRTAHFDEAERHVAAGLVARAADADLIGLRAQILLFQGDEAGARAAAEQALKIAPAAGDAVAARDELDLGDRAKLRLAGAEPGLAAGGAAAFVDQLIARVAGGAPAAEIARAFDLEILSSAPPPEQTTASLTAAVATAMREARSMRDSADQRFLGWVVAPDAVAAGDRQRVDVQVPVESTITARQRAAIGAAAADPALRGTVDPGILALIDGVPEAERAALLDRMVGVHTRSVLDLHFELIRAGDSFAITDLTIGEVSLKAQLANFSKVIDKVDPPKPGFRLTPELVGTALGVVVGVILVVVLVTRKRR